MNEHKAYLNVLLMSVPGVPTYIAVGAQIHSSPPSSLTGSLIANSIWTNVFTTTGVSFQEAYDRAIEYIESNPVYSNLRVWVFGSKTCHDMRYLLSNPSKIVDREGGVNV